MPNGEPPHVEPPAVEKVVETKQTIKASTEAAATALISPPTQIVIDDRIRWWLAFTVIGQFLGIVGLIIYKTTANVNNAEMMLLGAEIGFLTTVLNYFFGSSSGSTAKSAILNNGNGNGKIP